LNSGLTDNDQKMAYWTVDWHTCCKRVKGNQVWNYYNRVYDEVSMEE